MAKRIIVTESERMRILEMHKNHKMKELIKEDDYGVVVDLTKYKSQINAKWTAKPDGDVTRDPSGFNSPDKIQVNVDTIEVTIPKYSWNPNEKLLIFINVPKDLKLSKSKPSSIPGAEVNFNQNENLNSNSIAIGSKIQIENIGDRQVPKDIIFDNIDANTETGKLKIFVYFESGSIITRDTSSEPTTRNFEKTFDITSMLNGNLEPSKKYTVTTKNMTYYPEYDRVSVPFTYTNEDGDNVTKYYSYECGVRPPSESGMSVITLYDFSVGARTGQASSSSEVAIDTKIANEIITLSKVNEFCKSQTNS